MTRLEFLTICEDYTIEPSVALECDEVVEALRARDSSAVIAALENNF